MVGRSSKIHFSKKKWGHVYLWMQLLFGLFVAALFILQLSFSVGGMDKHLLRRRSLLEEDTSLIAQELSFTLSPSIPNEQGRPTTNLFNQPQQQDAGKDSNRQPVSTNETVPALLVGVASSVMICAFVLFVSDIKDHYRHERMLEEHRQRRRTDISSKYMQTVSSSGYGAREEFDRKNVIYPPPMLPQLNQDFDAGRSDQPGYAEDISLSTMTFSLALDSGRHSELEGLDKSIEITELADEHRVSHGVDIASLVDLSRVNTKTPHGNPKSDDELDQKNVTFGDPMYGKVHRYNISRLGGTEYYDIEAEEDESGWTTSSEVSRGSDTSSEISIGTYLKSIHSSKSQQSSSSSSNSAELMGERCLEARTPQKSASDKNSLDRSPDTPLIDEVKSNDQNELAQLEQLYQSSEDPPGITPRGSDGDDGDETSTQDYVREIYFVPVGASRVSFGIEVESANPQQLYPVIMAVKEVSPFLGRVFVGDLILAINNEETVGLRDVDVAKRLRAFERDGEQEAPGQSEVVKLTVLSSKSDGSDTSSLNSSGTLDTGLLETAAEV